MDLQEKRVRNRKFIASPNFTVATFTALTLFHRNFVNLLNVVMLEGAVLDKIEKGEIDHRLPRDVLVETKNFVLLDGLAKIMMVIEGFFALSEAISNPGKGYKHVARMMAYYNPSVIRSFLKRFKNGEIPIWKLAGFPEISKLNLHPDDATFIQKLLNDSCKLLEKKITDIVDFYQCNMIAYYKLKHGLSFVPAMEMKGPEGAEYPSNVVLALHRSGNREPPCLCHKSKESFMREDLEWYDTVTIVPFWSHTFEKHSAVIADLIRMIDHVIFNHLDWASNCGEDYFPLRRKPDGRCAPHVFLPYKLEGHDKERFEHVVKKITDNMNVAEMQVGFNLNIRDEAMTKILKCIKLNQVATIWGPLSETRTSAVKVE